MPVRITIPTPLRKLTANVDVIEVEAQTVRDLIHHLDQSYPGIRDRLCHENGELRRFINIFVEGEDIRFLQNLDTKLQDGCDVSIVPAIAGGSYL
jgi:molybdopterin synthase sulfur carrier subunit